MSKRIMRNLALSLAAALVLVLLPVMPAAAAVGMISWESTVSGQFVAKETTLTQYTISTYDSGTGAYGTETVTINTNDTLGDKTNPIAISTEEELVLFGQQTSNNTDGNYYILDKEDGVYDMRGDEGYYMLPMFKLALQSHSQMVTPSSAFKGTLIGNGAVIQNANIGDYSTNTGYQSGLFSAMNGAAVCDLRLSGITLHTDSAVSSTGENGAGALVGYVYNSSVLNCHVSGVSYENTEHFAKYAGGLAGWIRISKIISCSVETTGVPKVNNNSASAIGGIAGGSFYSSLIENCVVDWNIEATSGWYVGGIVGDKSSSTVNRCGHIGEVLLDANISGTGGGIAGSNGGTVKNSFQHGDVTVNSGSTVYAGGIVGSNNTDILENCYQNGDVKATSTGAPPYVDVYAGGIAGRNYSAVKNSYHVGVVSVEATSGVTAAAGGLAGRLGGSVSYSYYKVLLPDPSGYYTTTGCGTFASADNSDITLFKDWTNGVDGSVTPTDYVPDDQTTLLEALNGWVDDNSDYTSWAADTDNINGGYPVLSGVGTEIPKTVTVIGAGTGGTASGVRLTGLTVNLNAGTKSGYSFDGWTSTDVTISNADSVSASFIMPNKHVTVTANWTPVTSGGYTPPPPGHGFTGGSTHTLGMGANLVHTTNKDFSLFSGVRVDGKTLTRDAQYKAESGSTVITLYADYLNTLSVGTHTLTVVFTDGVTVTAEFEILQWVNPFIDVDESDWFYGDVGYVYSNGLMTGTSTSPMLFSPYTPITRGMIVTIFYRLEGSPIVSGLENPFSDVAAGMYYADAVMWAADNGIVTGYGGKFNPDDNITRQDLAVILWRYAEFVKLDVSTDTDLSSFGDASGVAEYAFDAMRWACGAGIVTGKPGNLIDPRGTATRAEAAAMLHRLLGAGSGK